VDRLNFKIQHGTIFLVSIDPPIVSFVWDYNAYTSERWHFKNGKWRFDDNHNSLSEHYGYLADVAFAYFQHVEKELESILLRVETNESK
jgi:hypothetical protein